jgi:hypothetical protein
VACVGEVSGDHRGCALGVPQGALEETGVHASCEPRGGVGMPEGRDGHACCGKTGTVCGCAEGALDTGPTHGRGRQRTGFVIAPRGGKEPGLVPMGFPVSAEPSEGICGEGNVPVCGALAAVDMDLEALAIDVGDLQGEGFREPESQALDGGEGDLVVQGCGRLEEPPDLLNTADGGETVCGLRAHERQGVPVACEDVLREEADATVADAHGRWGEAVDVFPVQEGVLQLLFGEQVGRCAIELSQQAYCADVGLLGALALAAELKRSHHALTQWSHKMSPFES